MPGSKTNKILKGKTPEEIQESFKEKVNEKDLSKDQLNKYMAALTNIGERILKLEKASVRVQNALKKQRKEWEDVWTEVDKVYETRWDCIGGQLAAA